MHEHIKAKPVPESRGEFCKDWRPGRFEEIDAISALLDRALRKKAELKSAAASLTSTRIDDHGDEGPILIRGELND
jgi:hypothetical protein